MKKFLAVLLTLAMLMTSVSAFAAELNWSDLSEKAAEMDPNAQFCAIADTGLMMWVPSVFLAVELSEEDMEDGYIAVLTTEDESVEVYVFYMDLEGASLSDYIATAESYGYTDIGECTINGIPALAMTDPENDTGMLLFATDAGYAIAFGFYPFSDEGFQAVSLMMIGSLQVAAE